MPDDGPPEIEEIKIPDFDKVRQTLIQEARQDVQKRIASVIGAASAAAHARTMWASADGPDVFPAAQARRQAEQVLTKTTEDLVVALQNLHKKERDA